MGCDECKHHITTITIKTEQFHHPKDLPALAYHSNGTTQSIFFCACLLSLSIIRFISNPLHRAVVSFSSLSEQTFLSFLLWIDVWIFSSLRLLEQYCYKHSCILLLRNMFPFGVYLEVELQSPVCVNRRRQRHPTPAFLPGKPHGWRSLVGCSPWGRYESDTTERLHFHFSLSCN